MPIFLSLAALLVVVALFLLLRPLLAAGSRHAVSAESANAAIYRDQLAELDADLERGVLAPERHGEARAEIERRLVEDLRVAERQAGAARSGKLLALVLAVTVPAVAGGLYFWLGNPAALDPATRLGMSEQDAAEHRKMADLTAKLAEKMQAQPDDPKGWAMLARAYRGLNKLPESARAYARAVQLSPQDAELHADYAEMLAILQRGRIDGDALAMARKALEIDPKSEKALALLGTAAFDAKDFAGAIGYWKRLLALAPPGSEYATAVEGGIAQAQNEMDRAKRPPVTLSGTVALAPAIAAKAEPGDTLFVFAKAEKGPPMPLAVLKKQVKDLPLTFTLDESMAMAPGMSIATVDSVVVGARISKRGNPMPASGDLEGLSPPVKPGARGLSILIDRVVP